MTQRQLITLRFAWLCAGLPVALAAACDSTEPPPFAADASDATTSPSDTTTGTNDPDVTTGPTGQDTTVGDTTPVEPPPGPRTLAARAKVLAAMNAWRAKDLAAIIALSPVRARPILQAFTPGTAGHAWLFGTGSWRARAAAAWDGSFGKTRFSDKRTLVHVGELPDGDVVLVELRPEGDDTWLYGIIRSSRGVFEAFGALE